MGLDSEFMQITITFNINFVQLETRNAVQLTLSFSPPPSLPPSFSPSLSPSLPPSFLPLWCPFRLALIIIQLASLIKTKVSFSKNVSRGSFGSLLE